MVMFNSNQFTSFLLSISHFAANHTDRNKELMENHYVFDIEIEKCRKEDLLIIIGSMVTIVNKSYIRFNCYQNKYSEILLILTSTSFINVLFSLL